MQAVGRELGHRGNAGRLIDPASTNPVVASIASMLLILPMG